MHITSQKLHQILNEIFTFFIMLFFYSIQHFKDILNPQTHLQLTVWPPSHPQPPNRAYKSWKRCIKQAARHSRHFSSIKKGLLFQACPDRSKASISLASCNCQMHYPAVLSVVISILITREMEETFGKIEGLKERLRERKKRERERVLC